MLKAKEAEFASNLPEKSDAWRRPERLGSALVGLTDREPR